MIVFILAGFAAQLLFDHDKPDMGRLLSSKDIAGHSGQTVVPAALVEDLLHAQIYSGMSGPPDETGIRGCRDAMEFAERAAQLIEYARTHELQSHGPMPDAAEIQRISNSSLSRFTLGGVAGRTQFSHLRPSSLAFLKRNLQAAEALIEDTARRVRHTQSDVDQFFILTDCDFFAMATGADAEAALEQIEHGKDVRQAIWDHQDMYADDRGTAFETMTVSCWTDSKTRNAIQGLKLGQVSKPIEGPFVTLAIPQAHLTRNPFSSAEPMTPGEKERFYRVLTAAERTSAPISSMPFEWTSKTASLLEATLKTGMENPSVATDPSQMGVDVSGDEVRRKILAKTISLLDAGDLPEFAERLAVYSLGGTRTALTTLQLLAKISDNADIKARLGKCYAQAGDAKRAANCFAKACGMPAPSYGTAYRQPLRDQDIVDLLSSSDSWRIEPKDRSVLERRLATSAAERRKWDEARAHPKPLSVVDQERQRKGQEFTAYYSQLFKSQRNRELAFYRDKVAYLSERLTQISANVAHVPEEKRSAVKGLEEEMRQKRDRAASRLEMLKQQMGG